MAALPKNRQLHGQPHFGSIATRRAGHLAGGARGRALRPAGARARACGRESAFDGRRNDRTGKDRPHPGGGHRQGRSRHGRGSGSGARRACDGRQATVRLDSRAGRLRTPVGAHSLARGSRRGGQRADARGRRRRAGNAPPGGRPGAQRSVHCPDIRRGLGVASLADQRHHTRRQAGGYPIPERGRRADRGAEHGAQAAQPDQGGRAGPRLRRPTTGGLDHFGRAGRPARPDCVRPDRCRQFHSGRRAGDSRAARRPRGRHLGARLRGIAERRGSSRAVRSGPTSPITSSATTHWRSKPQQQQPATWATPFTANRPAHRKARPRTWAEAWPTRPLPCAPRQAQTA